MSARLDFTQNVCGFGGGGNGSSIRSACLCRPQGLLPGSAVQLRRCFSLTPAPNGADPIILGSLSFIGRMRSMPLRFTTRGRLRHISSMPSVIVHQTRNAKHRVWSRRYGFHNAGQARSNRIIGRAFALDNLGRRIACAPRKNLVFGRFVKRDILRRRQVL